MNVDQLKSIGLLLEQGYQITDQSGVVLEAAGLIEELCAEREREDVALRAHIHNLTTIVRMPNAEYVADKHNDAVKYLRERFIDHDRRVEGEGE